MKTLTVIATPIGNLDDVSLSMKKALVDCDVLFCESVSAAQRLYSILEQKPPKLVRYWQKTEQQVVDRLSQMSEERCALISDAGMPAISDPGYALVKAFHEHGWTVRTVSGPCAAISALAMSGMPTDSFQFSGFLPPKSAARKSKLRLLRSQGLTVVLYESPRRVIGLLEDVAEIYGADHQVFVVKEMSKIHERYFLGRVDQCLQALDGWNMKGEFALVVQRDTVFDDWQGKADVLVSYMSVHDASSCCSKLFSVSRSKVYNYLLGKSDA